MGIGAKSVGGVESFKLDIFPGNAILRTNPHQWWIVQNVLDPHGLGTDRAALTRQIAANGRSIVPSRRSQLGFSKIGVHCALVSTRTLLKGGVSGMNRGRSGPEYWRGRDAAQDTQTLCPGTNTHSLVLVRINRMVEEESSRYWNE